MKSRPEALDLELLAAALLADWDLRAVSLDYAPVGYGSHHWVLTTAGGRTHFVTVDDLDTMAWLGAARETRFLGLGQALGTARALREEGGLDFVVAPLPTRGGCAVRRLDDRFALAVYPLLAGQSDGFSDQLPVGDAAEAATLLARLHATTPGGVTPRVDVPLSGRAELDTALSELAVPWEGGPYADHARDWLSSRQSEVRAGLARVERLSDALTGHDLVVTHGEPHPGNIMRVGGRLVLIDWDTVALAPRERDLWMLADAAPSAINTYVLRTGHVLDETLMELYRLAWDLADAAAYVAVFRAPHVHSEDTVEAWTNLTGITWSAAGA